MKNKFIHACGVGNLIEVQKLAADNFKQIQNGFRKACDNNQLDVAKWLYEIYPNKLGIVRNNIICHCYILDLNFARWLLHCDKAPIFILEEALRCACFHGHLEFAKLIYEKIPHIHFKCVLSAFLNNHAHIILWIYSTGDIIQILQIYNHLINVCQQEKRTVMIKCLIKINPLVELD